MIKGLGSAVAEILAETSDSNVPFQRIGAAHAFSPHSGTQEYMQKQHGLDPPSIVESVLKLLRTAQQVRTSLAFAQ